MVADVRRVDERVVVLSHYPPRLPGLFPGDDDPDAMVYASVAELVCALKPVLVVTGREHRWAGLSASLRHKGGGTTMIVNPGPEGMVIGVGPRGERAGATTFRVT